MLLEELISTQPNIEGGGGVVRQDGRKARLASPTEAKRAGHQIQRASRGAPFLWAAKKVKPQMNNCNIALTEIL